MNKITRCKFRCTKVERTTSNGYVTLEALYDASLNNEDSAFCTHTPGGKLEMSLFPVAKADFFTPGASYYLDIQEVPSE